MSSDALRYDQWIAEALLSVVTRSIRFAATEGLPGEHHFYISFQTNHPGVEMPDHLRARYPEEMTIVLQHQYWDLLIDDKVFEVTLKFSGRKTRLRVPLGAITAFTDPSVSFGLQLKVTESGAATAPGGRQRRGTRSTQIAEPLAIQKRGTRRGKCTRRRKSPRRARSSPSTLFARSRPARSNPARSDPSASCHPITSSLRAGSHPPGSGKGR